MDRRREAWVNAALSSSLDSNTTVSVIGTEDTKETLTVDIQYSLLLIFDTHACNVQIFTLFYRFYSATLFCKLQVTAVLTASCSKNSKNYFVG